MCHVKVTRAAASLAGQTRVVLDSKRKQGEPDMGAEHDISELLYSIADGTDGQVLDALGPTVEFLTYQVDGETAEDYAAKFPSLIEGGTRICLDHGAKVLKLPYPGTPRACANVTALAGTRKAQPRPVSSKPHAQVA